MGPTGEDRTKPCLILEKTYEGDKGSRGRFPSSPGEEGGRQAGEDLREDGLSGCQGRGALEKEGAGTEVSFLWVLSSGT